MAKRIEAVDKLVGKNIRIFRTDKGVSQTSLGDAVGVTFQQIQKYETGSNRVGSSRLAMIAKVLDVPITRLDAYLVHFYCDYPNSVFKERHVH